MGQDLTFVELESRCKNQRILDQNEMIKTNSWKLRWLAAKSPPFWRWHFLPKKTKMYQTFQISILVYQLWGETTFLVPSRKPSPTVFSHPETIFQDVVTHHRSHFLPAVSLLSPLGGPTCFEEVKSSFWQIKFGGSKKCRKFRGKFEHHGGFRQNFPMCF